MYRSGKAAQRLLPLTPLLQTGDIIRMSMVDHWLRLPWLWRWWHCFREVFLLADPQVPRPRAAAMRGGRAEVLGSSAPASPHRGEDCDYGRRSSFNTSLFLLLVQVQTESYLTGTSGSYVEEMYESWARDPRSVHARYVRKIFYCPIATNIFMIFFSVGTPTSGAGPTRLRPLWETAPGPMRCLCPAWGRGKGRVR